METKQEAARKLRALLIKAISKECSCYEPNQIALATGGGLDSTVVLMCLLSAGVRPLLYTAKYDPNSKDLKVVRKLSQIMNLDLIEIEIPEPTAWNVKNVVDNINISSWLRDKSRMRLIRYAWTAFYLATGVVQNEKIKIAFTGHGADILCASFDFSIEALHSQDWKTYRNYLRNGFGLLADKAWSVWGRFMISHFSPFEDVEVSNYISKLPQDYVWDGENHPKAILEQAFANELPDFIVNRRKIYFGDEFGGKDFEEICRSFL